jgi:hypothetical protein
MFDNILEMRARYQQNPSNLKKLKTAFFGQFDSNSSGEKSKRLARRRVCEYWRSIRYAILNDVPKKNFVITNYKRMEEKMRDEGSDTSESVSSSFEGVINTPIVDVQLSSRTVSYAYDDRVNLGSLSPPPQPANTDSVPNTDSAQSLKSKKKNRKRKRSSSGRQITSQFLLVLDGDVFVCHGV